MAIHNPVTISTVDSSGNSVPIESTGGAVPVAGVGAVVIVGVSESVAAAADQVYPTDLDVSGLSRVMVHLSVAANDLDQFEIWGSTDGTVFESLYSTAGGYISPTGILVGTSGDLTTIAAASTGWYLMDVSGINTIRHILSGDGGVATVTMTYSGD